MMRGLALAVLLPQLSLPAHARAVSLARSALQFDEADAKNRPVSKVVTLLKDMSKQLQKEAEEDEEIYDKMACWCQTNDKEKTKSIATSETRIDQLNVKIEELTATSARLGSEITGHEKEVAHNQQALDTATSLREKQLAEFNSEEKDLLESIAALKSAVEVLSKHHEGGSVIHANNFLQVTPPGVQSVAATLQRAMTTHADLLKGVFSPTEKRSISAFIESKSPYQQYASQSGQIFGILQQMQETFEANLASSQKEETNNQAAYENLKAAKLDEIAAGQEQIEVKTEEKADTDEDHSQSTADLGDTQASLSADEEFLNKLKEKCSMTDKEWEERQKTRMLEMQAVSKALEVLSGDEAHDLFSRTLTFVQVSSSGKHRAREEAAQLLTSAARTVHNPRLATLAMKVKLDAFTRVKKAIDDMTAQLAKEKADEIKHKDFCVDELNSNQLQTEKKHRDRQDLEQKMEELKMKIDALAKAIETLKEEIFDMQVNLKRSGEDREKQNREFQMTVSDQRATQALLKKALGVLGEFYKKEETAKEEEASLLQRQEPVGPPPPKGFETYKKNAASGGVMKMIEQIAEDAKAMEKEAITSEMDAQKAYEDFVKETNLSIQTKADDITNKAEVKAKTEGEHVDTKEDHKGALADLDQLSSYNKDLHSSCDFTLKNFDLRQAARDQEVEALKQAKAILSGSKFEEAQ